MKKWKQGILYYALLSKRFFKKFSFVLLLCAIPLIVLCFRNISEEDSGMLRIALVAEDAQDAAVGEITAQLMQQESVVHYRMADTEEEAKELVNAGDVDAAWVFREGFMDKVNQLTEEDMQGEQPILVWERQDNVILQLSRLQLFATIYPYLSYSLYEDFAEGTLQIPDTVTEEELRELYEVTNMENGLFRLAYEDSDGTAGKDTNYIMAPFRGVLAVLVILAGLAADMFFQQDLEAGVLDSVSAGSRRKRVYVYQLATMLPMAVAVLVAMGFAGDFTDAGKELVWLGLYVGGSMFFCNIVRRICRRTRWLGVAMPLLLIGLMLLSPIFLDLRKFRPVQLLLPSYYYLSGLHTPGWIVPMLVYVAAGAVVNYIVSKCADRR